MSESKRVVLVEPGDILLIGNAGEFPHEAGRAFAVRAQSIGIEVMVFDGPIEMDVLKKADRG